MNRWSTLPAIREIQIIKITFFIHKIGKIKENIKFLVGKDLSKWILIDCYCENEFFIKFWEINLALSRN